MIRKYAWLVLTNWVAIFGSGGAILFTLVATYMWSNVMYLQILFAIIAISCVLISCYKVWEKEHSKVKELTKKLEESYSKLKIEVKDIFLCSRTYDREHPYFLTFILDVTNEKPENNTIKTCTLNLQSDTEEISSEWSANTYVKSINRDSKVISREPVIFSQGVPQEYSTSFAFHLDKRVFRMTETFIDKHYILKIKDSYGRAYEYKGKIPDNLVKEMRLIS